MNLVPKNGRHSLSRHAGFSMLVVFLIVSAILTATMGSWRMGALFGLQAVLLWSVFCGPAKVRIFCTGFLLGVISSLVIRFALWEHFSVGPGNPGMSPSSAFDETWMHWLGVRLDEPSLDRSSLVFTVRTIAAGLVGGLFALAAWHWLGVRQLTAWLMLRNRSVSQRVRQRWSQLPAGWRRFSLVTMWIGYGLLMAGWITGIWWRPFGPVFSFSLGFGLFLLFIAIAALQLRSSQPK